MYLWDLTLGYMASLLLFSAHSVVISTGLCKRWNNKNMCHYVQCLCFVLFCFPHFFSFIPTYKKNKNFASTYSFVVHYTLCVTHVLCQTSVVPYYYKGHLKVFFLFLRKLKPYSFTFLIGFTILFSVNLYISLLMLFCPKRNHILSSN